MRNKKPDIEELKRLAELVAKSCRSDDWQTATANIKLQLALAQAFPVSEADESERQEFQDILKSTVALYEELYKETNLAKEQRRLELRRVTKTITALKQYKKVSE